MASLTLWMNGDWVPEAEAKVSIFDDGFLRGDAVFDAARTFGGKPFQLSEHLDRFFLSCEAVKLTPHLDKAGLLAVARELVDKNQSQVAKHGDFWIDFRVSRGGRRGKGSTFVYCDPIPFAARAPLY